jgi:hypothetical protein
MSSLRDPLSPRDIRRVLVFCGLAAAMSVLVSTVLAITVLTTRGDVSQNTTNATVAKKRATVAANAATVAKGRATTVERKQKRLETKVIQTRVLVRQTRTILKQKGILGRTGATGRAGVPGPGPTVAQIDQAVASYCGSSPCGRPPTVDQVLEGLQRCSAGGGCRGADGSDGKDAPPPSDMQIVAAVTVYCAAHGGCAGDQGAPGADGVQGIQGPGPSDEQVQAAVDAYCTAHSNCSPTPSVPIP